MAIAIPAVLAGAVTLENGVALAAVCATASTVANVLAVAALAGQAVIIVGKGAVWSGRAVYRVVKGSSNEAQVLKRDDDLSFDSFMQEAVDLGEKKPAAPASISLNKDTVFIHAKGLTAAKIAAYVKSGKTIVILPEGAHAQAT